MSETQVNNFSLISRLFGNLFYRSPTDPILSGVFDWLQQQGLSQVWDLTLLDQEYQKLFGPNGNVPTAISSYDIDVQRFVDFRHARNVPEAENVDHFALLLLTASWLEDNTESLSAQQDLFGDFLLPCAAKFLTQVETYATLPFYRSLAYLTREILAAMADELEEGE